MIFRRNLSGKLLVVTLLVFLLFSLVLISPIWAEDSLTDLSSTIITDNAVSQVAVEVTVDSHQDTVKEDIFIEDNDQINVFDTATSSATTDDNQIVEFPGDEFINADEATSLGKIENEINTKMVVLELPAEPTGESVASASSQVVLGQTVEEEKIFVAENNNKGTVINNISITAQTGQNLASENLGEAQIETGDALASANLLNLLNTNIVDSNFEFFLINLFDEEREEIDLNELWQQIQQRQATDSSSLVEETSLSELIITVQNQANLENNVEVLAGTGENQASQNDNVYIKTGNAAALANVTNIVNTNILDSKFFFGVINILDSTAKNLILPRPEGFAPQMYSQIENEKEGIIFSNQNQAEISNQIETLAETGANEENNNTGNNIVITGSAAAQANTFSLVNLNIWRNNSFFLLINNLGNWTGKIFSWSSPEAVEQPIEGAQTYQAGFDGDIQEREDIQERSTLPSFTLQNKNKATLSNNLRISALTGGNQAYENKGDVSTQTGNARSLVNLFNLVNLNLLSSRYFVGIVNILGDWSGDTIFAYPDLTVNLTNSEGRVMVGETTEYTLFYKNQGYDKANNVRVELELPQGLTFLGDSSGLTPEISGQNYCWSLGTIKARQEGAFTITVKINSNFSFEKLSSLWPEDEVVVTASIETDDPESDLSNNSSSVKTLVYFPISSATESKKEEINQGQPKLDISVWNNVGEFVYPGDTITFEITVSNTGEASSYNTRLTQELFSEVLGGFGIVEFDLGTIEAGKSGKLSFGLKLADNGELPNGAYYTITIAKGLAPNGHEVTSNKARTNFNIKNKKTPLLLEAKAVEEEKILGGTTMVNCPKTREIFPYILLFILILLWLLIKTKRRLK